MRLRGFLALSAALALVLLGTTAPARAADPCPNATFRTGPSTTLPDCRAFEMVSPPTKNGNDVSPVNTIQTASSGDAAAYYATGAFLGSDASVVYAVHRSVRSAEGWSTRGLVPPQTNSVAIDAGPMRELSADLTRGLAYSRRALAPGATDGDGNIFLEDLVTGAYQYIGGSSDPNFMTAATNIGFSIFGGADDTFDHVVIKADYPLTPDAPAGTSLFEIANGGIRLASVLPDGNPVDGTVRLGNGSPVAPVNHAVSADGRRIFFEVRGGISPYGVYMREDGTSTVAISQSQRSGALPTDPPAAGKFGGASADGSSAFFITDQPLTDPAANPSDTSIYRLYRWKNGVLTEIAAGASYLASGTQNMSVLSVSDDGTYVYFVTQTALTGGGTTPVLYVWHEGDGLRRLATLQALPADAFPHKQYERGPSAWSLSPDGQRFAFSSLSQLTGQPTTNPNCFVSNGGPRLTGHCMAVYLYTYGDPTATPQCVSCDPAGGAPSGHATLGGSLFGQGLGRPFDLSKYMPRAVFDDGTVYFDSPDRLVGDDTDGKRDVYRWRQGELTLISEETATDSAFADASADQRDVFFVTKDRLVNADPDDNRDLYDARAGGGLASQAAVVAPAPCRDDACQDAPSGSPDLSRAGSLTLVGPGNLALPTRTRPARVTVSRSAVRGGRFSLRTTVSGSGVVRASGSSIATVRRRVGKAGSYALRLSLTHRARRSLARHHRIRIRVRVVFAPTSGKASVTSVSLTVKA
jgi:hypothetical protein